MAAPGQDHQPDQGQDHTPGQDQEPDQGQRTKPDQQPRRTCDGEKSRAGDVGQRRTAPDWTGPAWETDPPGLHQPDRNQRTKPGQDHAPGPDHQPDRGPLRGAIAPAVENGLASSASRTRTGPPAGPGQPRRRGFTRPV